MVRRGILGALALAAALVAAPATAQVTVASQNYTAAPGGAYTYDFDTSAPAYTGGQLRNTEVPGIAARPMGSTGNYFSVGPDSAGGGMATISFADYTLPVGTLSFLWGSGDGYNSMQFFGDSGNIGQLFTGADVADPADGNQGAAYSNRWVTFTFQAGAQAVRGMRLFSTQNAMELDNILVTPGVPEPASWAMMILGCGMVGGALRARRSRLALAA